MTRQRAHRTWDNVLTYSHSLAFHLILILSVLSSFGTCVFPARNASNERFLENRPPIQKWFPHSRMDKSQSLTMILTVWLITYLL